MLLHDITRVILTRNESDLADLWTMTHVQAIAKALGFDASRYETKLAILADLKLELTKQVDGCEWCEGNPGERGCEWCGCGRAEAIARVTAEL